MPAAIRPTASYHRATSVCRPRTRTRTRTRPRTRIRLLLVETRRATSPILPQPPAGGLHGDRCHAKLRIRPDSRRFSTALTKAFTHDDQISRRRHPLYAANRLSARCPLLVGPRLKLGSAVNQSQCNGPEQNPRNQRLDRLESRQYSAETCSSRASLARVCIPSSASTMSHGPPPPPPPGNLFPYSQMAVPDMNGVRVYCLLAVPVLLFFLLFVPSERYSSPACTSSV